MSRFSCAMVTAVVLAAAALLDVSVLATSSAQGAVALIINGASVTSEPSTTAAITANLASLLTAAGFTPTTVDAVPGSLAGWDQVWDIRFSNSSPLTAGNRALYVGYLNSGGGMFVMGENAGFSTRNTSVLDLISDTGAGSLAFDVPSSIQTVLAPFTGPNAVASITYAAPGGVGVAGPGTGQYITVDGFGRGTGLAFGAGDMPNALTGALTVVFDVNFMQNNVDAANSQPLLKNLIGFIDEQTTPNVPEAATVVIWSLLGLMGLAYCRRSRS